MAINLQKGQKVELRKSDGGTLRFILIRDIGESLIHPLTRAELLAALA